MEPLRIAETFRGKHILITGVTGFLGKVWLSMLLTELPEIRRMTLLARGRKGVDAKARFEEIAERSPALRPFRALHGPDFREVLSEKVDVVEACLSADLCGLSEAEASRLMSDVDLVVHVAGLTDFEPDPPLAIEANLRGALNVAELAKRSAGKRMIHISTCFVAGRPSREVPEFLEHGVSPLGVKFDPRQELDELSAEMLPLDSVRARTDHAMARGQRLGWPNIYTYTKGLAEHLLLTIPELDVSIVRPAIVECARSFPMLGWNEGINTSGPLVWLLGTTFCRFPSRPTNRFDVVPVDTVARSMTLAAAESMRGEGREIYHVASSQRNPLSFGRAVELTALAWRRIHGREQATAFESLVLRHLEGRPVEADQERFLDVHTVRRVARSLRALLKGRDAANALPERMRGELADSLNRRMKSASMKCRNLDRQLGRVDDMLRTYRPFIHDHDWIYETEALPAATRRLDDAERQLFGFDVDDIDWRRYWLDVQVPGLETWCIPLLKGDSVPEDEPLPLAHGSRRAGRRRAEEKLGENVDEKRRGLATHSEAAEGRRSQRSASA
ncbi:MAG: NAD-dependent epimerase/dehydratase family protein [Deltaproteobacteria bacterium]|nr:NAD-dependent epimerase/dehydratase family protein [Deltaproteobacteria bacterium]